jgi:dTDP-4-amino-4,6-dideoxygalactose transaminase
MIPRTTVDLGEDERDAILRVLDSGQYVKGKECELLEEEFSKFQGIKFGIGVNSGTSALVISLMALGINQGDEVITTPNTFAATVNAIIMAGGKPKFVDIDPSTFNIDTKELEKAITDKTKAVIPVHLYGLMSDMKKIREIADNKNISIIEDACQAHGAEYFGKRAGQLGDLAAFSFFPTKNVTVGGDGGIILTNNEELMNKAKALRDHGRINGKHEIAGLNNRLSEILAAIGRSHLKKLNDFTEHRIKIANVYNKGLAKIKEIEIPYVPDNYKHVYHLYTLKAKERDKLKKYLKDNNIGSKVMYEEKLNELKYVQKISGIQQTPVNDKISNEILSLPISGTLPLESISIVVEKIKNFYDM